MLQAEQRVSSHKTSLQVGQGMYAKVGVRIRVGLLFNCQGDEEAQFGDLRGVRVIVDAENATLNEIQFPAKVRVLVTLERVIYLL